MGELGAAWEIVAPGGVLFGDDWNWDSVRNDVVRFSKSAAINQDTQRRFMSVLPGCRTEERVTLAGIHWFLFK